MQSALQRAKGKQINCTIIRSLTKTEISNMNKLSYNTPCQRITADNYWLGGGMMDNLVDPYQGTLDMRRGGDVNQPSTLLNVILL